MTTNMKSAAIDLAAKSPEELISIIKEASDILRIKREEAMDRLSIEYVTNKHKLHREYVAKMKNDFNATDDEIHEYFDLAETMVSFEEESMEKPVSAMSEPQMVENSILALPEPAKIETEEGEQNVLESALAGETDEIIKQDVADSSSIFDSPELSAAYNPTTDNEDNTSISADDEPLPSFDELFATDRAYNESIAIPTSTKKKLPHMDDLLSGEPINSILCLGNLKPKGTSYRQHTRINDADGIIPTETAVGNTLISIN